MNKRSVLKNKLRGHTIKMTPMEIEVPSGNIVYHKNISFNQPSFKPIEIKFQITDQFTLEYFQNYFQSQNPTTLEFFVGE